MAENGPILLEVALEVVAVGEDRFKLSMTKHFTGEELMAFMDDFRFRAEYVLARAGTD